MSTDICLCQIKTDLLYDFRSQPRRLRNFVEEEAASCLAPFSEKLDRPVGQFLSIDEFTRGLLTDQVMPGSPLFPIQRAIQPAHMFAGASMEYGIYAYHSADEVREISESLSSLDQGSLKKPLQVWLDLMGKTYTEADYSFMRTYFQMVNLAQAEHWQPEEAVRSFQQASFDRLVQFFGQAAQDGTAVLVIIS